jgi:aminopeptidase YwaD
MSLRKSLSFLLFVALSGTAFSQRSPEITAKDLKADVYYLASDTLEGRKSGTITADIAASYIRFQFLNAGLTLMGSGGFQSFEIVADVSAGIDNYLKVDNNVIKTRTDFTPVVFSSNGSLTAPVVFAGYGFDINIDSLKWNDYDGVNVKGKWVLIFRGDPELDNSDSKFIPYGEVRGKVLTAKDHGAGGVLLVTPTGLDKDDKLMQLLSENNQVTAGIPVINIKRTVADLLLRPVGYTADSLERILNRTRKPKSIEIQLPVTGITQLNVKKSSTMNVIGMLPGTDPVLKDEYIVIGGHYDHLGFGGPNSGSRMPDTNAVHNGADDNASGTALVLELAGKLASVKNQLKRSVIFVCFTGEEMGLLGSKYFVDHPPVDLKKIKAMFNFDMVGRFDKEKNSISVSGTGTSLEADSILKIYEKDLPFKVTHSPEGYGPSDHASFYASNIPVFFFTTGVHMDYHTPFDKAAKLDYDSEKKIGDYAYQVIMNVDRMNHDLTFREAGKKEGYNKSGRRLKVTLGIMPDFAGSETKGLRVDGVTKGGPADLGGMKKGDIITSVNGMKVGNIYEYMSRLGKLNQGQRISVEVLRDGKTEILIIQL